MTRSTVFARLRASAHFLTLAAVLALPLVGCDDAPANAQEGQADAAPLDAFDPAPDRGPDGATPDSGLDAALDAAPADATQPDAEPVDAIVDAALPDLAPLYPTPRSYAEDLAAQPRTPPPVPEYSGGECPPLVFANTAADSFNPEFPSGVDVRQFRIIVPADYNPEQSYPLVFAWHWLAGDSNQMVREGRIETAATQVGFITVVFDRLLSERGNAEYIFSWPFAEEWGQAQEMLFFNDVFACVNAQFKIDTDRVYAVGVSAGALWLTFLMNTPLIDHFAAVEILSGGLAERGVALRMTHEPRDHKFPAFVLWGGPSDRFVIEFEPASLKLREALMAHHHFVVSCTHDAGHGLPPVTEVEGEPRFRMLWRFMLDHVYGMDPGASPYFETGLPEQFESWCEVASEQPPGE